MKACCDVEANKFFFDSKKQRWSHLKFFFKLKTVIFAKQKTVSNCTYNYVKKVMTKILTIRTYSNEIYWFDWQIFSNYSLFIDKLWDWDKFRGFFHHLSLVKVWYNPCQLMLPVLWGGLCHIFEHQAKIRFFQKYVQRTSCQQISKSMEWWMEVRCRPLNYFVTPSPEILDFLGALGVGFSGRLIESVSSVPYTFWRPQSCNSF